MKQPAFGGRYGDTQSLGGFADGAFLEMLKFDGTPSFGLRWRMAVCKIISFSNCA